MSRLIYGSSQNITLFMPHNRISGCVCVAPLTPMGSIPWGSGAAAEYLDGRLGSRPTLYHITSRHVLSLYPSRIVACICAKICSVRLRLFMPRQHACPVCSFPKATSPPGTSCPIPSTVRDYIFLPRTVLQYPSWSPHAAPMRSRERFLLCAISM